MFLAIDIGNTGTKFGLFKKEEPFEMTFRFPTASIIRGEDIEGELLPKLSALGDITSAVIASVVPKATEALKKIVQRIHPDLKTIVLGNADIPLVNLYADPNQVGIDRLVASYAAYTKWGADAAMPVIVINFGTATTFDCITARGEYLGGVITLGAGSSAQYLSSVTAQLPEIELAFPKSIVGKTTKESIQSGIFFGALSITEGLVTRLKHEAFSGSDAIVIAAGGLASLFEGRTAVIDHYAPFLVLEGIALLSSYSS